MIISTNTLSKLSQISEDKYKSVYYDY